MALNVAPFVKGEEFWCNDCDGGPVHSDKPITGLFFSVFGHEWDHKLHKTDGNYPQVIFALCTTCMQCTFSVTKILSFLANYENYRKSLGAKHNLDVG